jgi:hypothetical protein
MKHRNSHFAVGYWSRIRYGRAVPDQTDIDPKVLKRLLPFVFLLDALPDGTFIYRLAGTALCERYGGELRGRNFFGLWDADSRARVTALLHQALAQKIPACMVSVGATEDCRMLETETVLMPLSYGDGAPRRFLGVAQILTDVNSLAGRPITFERLISSKLVREDQALFSAPEQTTAPIAGWRAHPRAPHLKLVASNEDIARQSQTGFDESLAR